MTYFSPGRVYILNVIKNSKWYPVIMVTGQNRGKGEKNVFTSAKISQDTETVQNLIFDMLLSYNKAMI